MIAPVSTAMTLDRPHTLQTSSTPRAVNNQTALLQRRTLQNTKISEKQASHVNNSYKKG